MGVAESEKGGAEGPQADADGRALGTLLLTGAPGWLTEALLLSYKAAWPRGLRKIRCLVRHNEPSFDPRAWVKNHGVEVEVVRGDLTRPDSLRAAVAGVDSVLHAAAIIHVDRIRDYYAVNTEGTRALAVAARDAGASRFVLLSSNAAGGRSDGPNALLTEQDPPRPLSHYGRSKLLAEKAMFGAGGPMTCVALRPCMFYGPPVPPRHIEIFKRIVHGRMPLVGKGDYPRSIVHIEHAVQASQLALSKTAAANNTYYVADAAPHTLRTVIEAMAEALGVEPRWLPIPELAAKVAHGVDTLVNRFGRYWQTAHLVGEANWNVGVSVEKARRELGFDPKYDAAHGMRAAVEWSRERGLL